MSVVLVTGAAGYLGNVLTEILLQQGHEVIALDRFFFVTRDEFVRYHGDKVMDAKCRGVLNVIQDDIRSVSPTIFDGVDAVIDLAAISNDPSANLLPALTWDINCYGRSRMAFFSKIKKIRKYIFASSCSVYGFQDEIVNETSPVNPLTTYASAAVSAEKIILGLTNDVFQPIILRQATLYGPSKRMRYDLAINIMTYNALKEGHVRIDGDGNQKRPFLHVYDSASVFAKMATQDFIMPLPRQVFNVGGTNQTVRQIAKTVVDTVHGHSGKRAEITYTNSNDARSYAVDFSLLRGFLTWVPICTISSGVSDILFNLKRGELQKTPQTSTIGWYRQLLEMDAVLGELYSSRRVL